MPNTFMPTLKNEVETLLPGGVKVRLFRAEPFRFMNEITKFLESIHAGEIQAFHMNTDANGWCNFAIAYREYKDVPQAPDPVVMLYDTVSILKDIVEEVGKLSQVVAGLSKTEHETQLAKPLEEVPSIGV